MRISSYIVRGSNDMEKLVAIVNSYTQNGYQPVGGICVDNEGTYIQAMELITETKANSGTE